MWFGMAIYTALFRPLLFRLSPERAQALADWFLERRLLMQALSPYFNCRDSRLRVSAGGLTFPSPVGMAAGYDKDCRFLDGLLSLGFGYVVGGTVTREARIGNPRPRLMRLPDRQSLINALGFPGKGLDAAKAQLERLQARRGRRLEPVVVSVAGLTIDEFLACHTALQPLCDAIELNISSPNTRGIRVFQEPQSFRDLLSAVNAQRSKPLFVKIPPYTDGEGRERVLALARIAVEQGVSGITAANTRPVEAPRLAMGQGGLSGRVLLEDTLRIVADVRSEVGSDVAIHACGGISTTDDALRALKAGADTVQLLTGLIYQGPGVARAINRGLVKRMEWHAAASLGDLAKTDAGGSTP